VSSHGHLARAIGKLNGKRGDQRPIARGQVARAHIRLASRITDDGLTPLQELPNLTELNVSLTQVSDRGLLHLKGLPKLSALSIRSRNVTDAGISQIKRARPTLKFK
jgi:Leucine Rich repeat